jgi:serine/threonine-protein kinase
MALVYRADHADTAAGLADDQQRALEAAEQAVALAPALAEARVARGYVRASIRWDFLGAQADLEKALATSPGDANTMRVYASFVLSPLGRVGEAIALLKKATDLDPLADPAWQNLAFLYNGTGNVEQARQALRRALEIAPDDSFALSQLTTSHLLEGNAEAARAAARRCPMEQLRLAAVALAEFAAGDRAASDGALGELSTRWGHDAAYQVAEVHAWREERDQAFEWLERAARQHDSGLFMLKYDPLLRSLRSDPRYAAMLRRMSLPAD